MQNATTISTTRNSQLSIEDWRTGDTYYWEAVLLSTPTMLTLLIIDIHTSLVIALDTH